MGTRAMILIGGKPAFSTHWDGDVDWLGKDLAKIKKPTDIKGIIRVGKKHSIDNVQPKYAKAAKIKDKQAIWAFKPKMGDFYEYEYNIGKSGIKWRKGSKYGGTTSLSHNLGNRNVRKGTRLYPIGKWHELKKFGKIKSKGR